MGDDRSYIVSSSFYLTGDVEDLELSISPNALSRKVLRAELVQNSGKPENSVKISIVHQKRRITDEEWTDLAGTDLRQTTFNSPSKFPLDTAETRQLFDSLCDLYQISKDGINRGKEVVHVADPDQWVRTDAPRATIIKALLESDHGAEVWQTLVELQPDLANQLSAALVHKQRESVLDTFEAALEEDHNEEYWRQLLRENTWIFGGANVSVIPESRIDMGHVADIPFEVEGGFMDLVELKKPDFSFWTMTRHGTPWKYRGKFLTPHPELNGAIAQTRHYILQAEKHVANTDFQRQHGVVPLKPRGLVVHGRSASWGTDEWEAFRLLNDGLHGVQVITFDHLLAQGRRSLLKG
jgi:hypothetical protein